MLSRTLLIRSDDEVRQNLQILFNGTPVQDVYLLQIRISNSGNVPVIASDYASHLGVRFAGCARLLTAEVSETNPLDLRGHINISTLESKSVAFSPVLLNSGDFFVIKMLVSQLERSNGFAIEGRIAGVSEIYMVRERQTRPLVLMLLGMAITIIGIIQLEKTVPPTPSLSEKLGERWNILAPIIVSYGFMVAGIASRRKLLSKVIGKVLRALREDR